MRKTYACMNDKRFSKTRVILWAGYEFYATCHIFLVGWIKVLSETVISLLSGSYYISCMIKSCHNIVWTRQCISVWRYLLKLVPCTEDSRDIRRNLHDVVFSLLGFRRVTDIVSVWIYNTHVISWYYNRCMIQSCHITPWTWHIFIICIWNWWYLLKLVHCSKGLQRKTQPLLRQSTF